jgi:hypothetical protein
MLARWRVPRPSPLSTRSQPQCRHSVAQVLEAALVDRLGVEADPVVRDRHDRASDGE